MIDRDPMELGEFHADHLHRVLRDFDLVHLAEKMNHHAPVNLHDHNLVKIVQLAVVALTAPVQPVKFLKVVKSAIHAGFAQLHRNATNHEFVHASLNRIFLKTLQVKNSRRAFAQSY